MQIYLIGFMGAGKTTVGRQLATKLNRRFIDLDDVIEQETNLAIPIIFETYGEKFFRQLETTCLEKISQHQGSVVATGGGIVLSDNNRKIMRATGQMIYLSWPLNILYARIKNSPQRPLLKGINQSQLYQHVKTLLRDRRRYYEQADYIIYGDERTTPDETVTMILQKINSQSIEQLKVI